MRVACTWVFAVGTALALMAGALAAPLHSVYPALGDGFLIISFVVVAAVSSSPVTSGRPCMIGLVDTLGKAYARNPASHAMAVVLLWRPSGVGRDPRDRSVVGALDRASPCSCTALLRRILHPTL